MPLLQFELWLWSKLCFDDNLFSGNVLVHFNHVNDELLEVKGLRKLAAEGMHVMLYLLSKISTNTAQSPKFNNSVSHCPPRTSTAAKCLQQDFKARRTVSFSELSTRCFKCNCQCVPLFDPKISCDVYIPLIRSWASPVT